MNGRRTFVLSAAAAAALVAAGGAQATIVPGKSIAGVKLTLTRSEVKAKLGPPRRVAHGSNEFGTFTVFRYHRLRITFQGNGGATDVSTTRRNEQTTRGVGVGSKRRAVRNAYPAVSCTRVSAHRGLCQLGKSLPGHRVTVFRLRDGVVRRVEVGFVID